jgi:hypothetical protein
VDFHKDVGPIHRWTLSPMLSKNVVLGNYLLSKSMKEQIASKLALENCLLNMHQFAVQRRVANSLLWGGGVSLASEILEFSVGLSLEHVITSPK